METRETEQKALKSAGKKQALLAVVLEIVSIIIISLASSFGKVLKKGADVKVSQGYLFFALLFFALVIAVFGILYGLKAYHKLKKEAFCFGIYGIIIGIMNLTLIILCLNKWGDFALKIFEPK